ncbi:MAG: hypothetical protein RSD04_02785 [Clostridia bacterium]
MKNSKLFIIISLILVCVLSTFFVACSYSPKVETQGELYEIIITPMANGDVTANKVKARDAETISLTVTPKLHYLLKEGSLRANGVAIKGTAFLMPKENVYITAIFEKDSQFDPLTYAGLNTEWNEFCVSEYSRQICATFAPSQALPSTTPTVADDALTELVKNNINNWKGKTDITQQSDMLRELTQFADFYYDLAANSNLVIAEKVNKKNDALLKLEYTNPAPMTYFYDASFAKETNDLKVNKLVDFANGYCSYYEANTTYVKNELICECFGILNSPKQNKSVVTWKKVTKASAVSVELELNGLVDETNLLSVERITKLSASYIDMSKKTCAKVDGVEFSQVADFPQLDAIVKDISARCADKYTTEIKEIKAKKFYEDMLFDEKIVKEVTKMKGLGSALYDLAKPKK